MNPRDAEQTAGLTTKYLRDYAPPDYRVPTTMLHFDIGADATRVTAKLQVERAAHAAGGAPLWLDGKRLKLQSIKLDGQTLPAAAYVVSEQGLRINEPAAGTALASLAAIAGLLGQGIADTIFFRPEVQIIGWFCLATLTSLPSDERTSQC